MTTAKKPAANSKGTAKRVVGRPFSKGVSGNPAGRPKTGESWSEIFRQVGEMYPEDVVAIVGANNDLGKAYNHFPKNVQMKIQVAIRVVAALMFEPTQGLLKETLDRIEGKVPERLQMEGTLGIDGLRQMIAKVYGTTSDDPSK
jgi:hypothetical protein